MPISLYSSISAQREDYAVSSHGYVFADYSGLRLLLLPLPIFIDYQIGQGQSVAVLAWQGLRGPGGHENIAAWRLPMGSDPDG